MKASSSAHAGRRPLGYALYQWLIYIPLAALTTLVSGLLAVPLALLLSPRVANRVVGANWARMLAWLVPVRVRVEGLEHVDQQRSYVVVANHQSQFDIPVVYGWSGLDLRWVAKAELSKIPFLSLGSRAIGHVFINRSDPDQAREAIRKAVTRMRPGTALMFFAEGTRSRSGELLPFKKGAFRVAVDEQLPVLPMTIVGTRRIMPPGSLRICPGQVRVIIHPALETAGMERDDCADLRQRCHEVVASALPPVAR